jgi:uridine kinase
MEEQLPQLIGIAGGSCAGKSWLAARLQQQLGKMAGRLSLDDFYRDRSYLSPGRKERINFDHPRAIDWERVETVLTELSAGRSTSVPRYNFETHGRHAAERILAPAPVVLFEGLWLWNKPNLRKLFTYKIFLKSPLELCEQRRLDRDVRERGRSPESVKLQFWRDTAPMYERYVAPQERWADLVLEQGADEQVIDQISQVIKELLKKSRTKP